jgi:hypothetical protein
MMQSRITKLVIGSGFLGAVVMGTLSEAGLVNVPQMFLGGFLISTGLPLIIMGVLDI